MSANRNKINPIGFACLIGKIAAIRGEELYPNMVKDFYDMVLESVLEPPLENAVSAGQISAGQIVSLMAAIKNGWKIEAIKIYRTMFSVDLATAKRTVEAQWPEGIEPKPYPSQLVG